LYTHYLNSPPLTLPVYPNQRRIFGIGSGLFCHPKSSVKYSPRISAPKCSASAAIVHVNTVALPISPPPGALAKFCDCGNPVAELTCKGHGNPENLGRMMYVCPCLEGEKCKFFQWAHETSRRGEPSQTTEHTKSDRNGNPN